MMLVWSGGRGTGRKEKGMSEGGAMACLIREGCQRKSKKKLSLSKRCFDQIEGFEISLYRSLSGDHAQERVPTRCPVPAFYSSRMYGAR